MTDLSAQSHVSTQDSGKGSVNKLAVGLLALYQPELEKVRRQLEEVTKKQVTLINQLQDENSRFIGVQSSEDLQQMFVVVKLYQSKLVTIKKDMSQIHDKATKLKKRALKLQQTKQRAALHREQQRELQLQRETDLIAKPVKRS